MLLFFKNVSVGFAVQLKILNYCWTRIVIAVFKLNLKKNC